MEKIILASGSRIRRQLLDAAGLRFTQRSAEIDERALERSLSAKGADVEALADALAAAKAEEVSKAAPEAVVIGADQILSVHGQPLGKADSLAEARARLWALRDDAHQLVCGVALARGGATVWRHVAVTSVRLRAFTPEFLDAYLQAVGEPVLASVCCYEIEGRGAQLIERIDGDYFSALGLPVLPLLEALRREGALAI